LPGNARAKEKVELGESWAKLVLFDHLGAKMEVRIKDGASHAKTSGYEAACFLYA
jgi:hypothetical protein